MNKKILLLIIGMLLCTQLVLASSVTRSFSKTVVNPGESLTITLNVAVTGGDTYYAIDELLPSTDWVITNNGGGTNSPAGHLKWVVVSGATSTSYIYTVTAPSTSGTYLFNGTYGFDDLIIHNILGQTQVIVNSTAIPGCVQNWSCSSWSSCVGGLQTRMCSDLNSCGNSTGKPSESQSCSLPGSTDTDDLMVNYVRGKITIDGTVADSSVQYKVEVLNGANEGYTYTSSVDDSQVYSGKLGNGYFDTGDSIKFNTNDQFRVTITNKNCTSGGSVESAFVNGGNGDFNDESSLIILNCISPPKINAAPVLSHINDLTLNETQLAKITANATDADGDSLTYSISDSRFNKTQEANSGAVFEWQTGYSDESTFNVLVSVSDGNSTASQLVRVTVNDLNLLPAIFVEDQNILEDSGTHYANITANDSDGSIVGFNIIGENTSQVNCDTIYTDSLLKFTPAKDFFGIAYCNVEAVDNKNGKSSINVMINVTNVNDAPIIVSYTPSYNNPKIPENGNQLFSVVVSDIDGPTPINVDWYFNGVWNSAGNSSLFSGDGSSGNYNITAVASDGNLSSSVSWNLTTSDIPLTEKYDGETTDFSNMTEEDLQCVYLVLERVAYGKVRWIDCVNMSDVVDLDRFTEILRGIAGVDSNVFPSFKNKRAEVSFYNLSFAKIPTIYYNSGFTLSSDDFTQVCSSSVCSDTSYSSSKLMFDITGFSTFKAGDTRTCGEQGGIICKKAETCTGNWFTARDTDKCCASQCEISFSKISTCENKSSSISVEFNDPDDGDEFEAGDTIDGEINIENNLDEDQKFSVNVYLYDVDKQKKIDSFKKKVSVDSEEDEDVEFTLEIPSDLDEGTYYLFAKAEDDVCNQAYISTDISEKDHYIVLDNVQISTPTVYPGSNLEGYAYVKNLGSNDEDVYLNAKSPELGASQKTGTFEVQEGEKEQEYFSLLIPENTKEGIYSLILDAISSDSEDSKELMFSVSNPNQGSGSGNNPIIVLLSDSRSGSQGGAYILGPSSSGSGSNQQGASYVLKEKKDNGLRIFSVPESDNSNIRVNFQESEKDQSVVYVGVSPEKQNVIYVQEKSSSHHEKNFLEKLLTLLTGKTYEISRELLILIDLIIAGGIVLLILSIILWVRRR